MNWLKKILLLTAFATGIAHAAPDYRFTLQSEHGTVRDSDFADKYLLLTFGYTSCPDICPLTLYELSKVVKKLDHPEKVQVIFISIDTGFETPEQIANYVRHFHPDFIGLTGDYSELKALGKRYGATFGFRADGKDVEPPNLPEKYSVYHSALVYLLSPERTMLERFAYQVKDDVMANVINRHVQ
ncbi:MAG: SCO family protein [Cardiobacteriaceae bacterium]|nr:SCO family protein [Cardiobacteriaceae bacterium]